jgi:hypothetical protein
MTIDVKTILSNTYAGATGATGALTNPTGFAAINTAKFGSIAGATGATGVVEIGNLTGATGVQGMVSIFGSLRVGGATGVQGATGTIQATNDITAYFSDERLKTRFENIQNPIEKINKLSGFYFEANELAQSLGYGNKREVGVSAQEMIEVLPEIVVPAPIDEKYWTVKYEKIAPLLIEAIKEQSKEIKEQSKEITELKLRVFNLENNTR